MTMCFKGHHADKKRMIYKSKFDGLQTYALFQKGYTCRIFINNDHSPNIYLDKRMLPLHDRVMAFFNNVEGKHHQCAMDNTYKSDAFSKVLYNHEKNY